jgi:hypothetical protein
MNKTQTVLLVPLTLVAAGLTAASVYQYKHSQNVTNAAVVKAQKQRDAAEATAAAYKLNLTAANTQVQVETSQKAMACQKLVALKQPIDACK